MLSERLKNLRKSKKLTQQDVADKIGISRASYSHIENDRNEPENAIVVKLAKFFDVSTDYLLGNDETPKWATQQDSIDLKAFLDGNLNPSMNYDGDDLTPEQKERLKLAMTQVFWEERQKDKKRAKKNGNDEWSK